MTARGAASPTSPQRLPARERGARAVELRVLGWTFDEIAKQLGYTHRAAAQKAVAAQMAKREKPAADQLAQLHMDRLELACRRIMVKLSREKPLTSRQLAQVTLALTRVLAAEAKYVDVYSEGQGLGPVASLLEKLLDPSSAPAGADPDDPMTVPVEDDDTP
jgi:hypothetical protein